MTEEEIRHEILSCVKEHGAERAKKLLYARLENDPAFLSAAITYGLELLQAIKEAEGATTN